jgi:hypothetical protein
MPNNFDFSNCISEIKTVEINPKGWRGPITIEYSEAQVSKYDPMLSVVWRVQGTRHTFTIYERRLNVISHANYKAHFTEALENFREDYLSWFETPGWEQTPWVKEYQQQYGRFILPKSTNN